MASAPTPAIPGADNPFAQLAVPATDPSGSPPPRRKRPAAQVDDAAPAAPTPRRPDPPQAESDDDYAHRLLTHIFHLTLDPHQLSTGQSHRLAFLPNLNQELNDAGEPLRLSVAVLDQAIIEACANWPLDRPLMDYLLPCWKRAVKAAASAKTAVAARLDLLQEVKRLCMSNCLFCLTMPVLYGYVPLRPPWFVAALTTAPSRDINADHDTLVPYLLRGMSHDAGLDFEFVHDAIARFDDDEAFPALFNNAMVDISNRLSKLSFGDDYKPHVQVRHRVQDARRRQTNPCPRPSCPTHASPCS